MKQLGLLGKNIGYSFSRNYFSQKFINQSLTDKYNYQNFDIPTIQELPNIIKNTPNLIGLNVTIPYKEAVLPYLDKISTTAQKIGAVNTIKINQNGSLYGDNTDYYGFIQALQPLLNNTHKKALILGTGGAAKAIVYALQQLEIESQLVSRTVSNNTITYQQINQNIFKEHTVIVNCTPIGTFPNITDLPQIPYCYFTKNHIAFDLIYNPEKTAFLTNAQKNGAIIQNGYQMLVNQAEKAWEIWNSPTE